MDKAGGTMLKLLVYLRGIFTQEWSLATRWLRLVLPCA